LSELASQKFEETASSAWQDTSFIPALKIIYEETFDRTLKNIAIKLVTAHVDKFLAKKEFTEFCELNGGFSLDILRATRPGPMPKPQPSFLGLIPVQFGDSCRKCGDEFYPDLTSGDMYGYMCAGCGTQVVLEMGDTEEEFERFLKSRFTGLGLGLRDY